MSTVGLDETAIREYIRNQERLDRSQQGNLHFGDDVDL